MFAVADGVGGNRGGEYAAETAINTITISYPNVFEKDTEHFFAIRSLEPTRISAKLLIKKNNTAEWVQP